MIKTTVIGVTAGILCTSAVFFAVQKTGKIDIPAEHTHFDLDRLNDETVEKYSKTTAGQRADEGEPDIFAKYID